MSTASLVSNGAAERRSQRSLTADAERRLLVAIAGRLPDWVHPDLLTLLGLAGQLLAGIAYVGASWQPGFLLLVDLALAINWFGDSLDGTLARVRQRQRPKYGFYVDHVCDLIGTTVLCTGMAASGYVHAAVAAAMLFGFFTLAAESFLATVSLGIFEMAQFWFGPTELRFLLMVGNVALLVHPYANVLGHRWLLFDIGGVIGSAAMLVTALITAGRHTAQLHRAGA